MTTLHARGWVPRSDAFGARLAAVRYIMGWNLKEAALACNITAASWRSWELNGVMPRDYLDVSRRISARTGCDLQWLTGIDAGPFEDTGVVLAEQGLPHLDSNQKPFGLQLVADWSNQKAA